jgi:hypothetical protein
MLGSVFLDGAKKCWYAVFAFALSRDKGIRAPQAQVR